MKILVCITNVPDTTAKIGVSADHKSISTNNAPYIIGPYDDYALARAVELRDQTSGKLTVLHVGGPEADPQIRKALAIGADDAIRINLTPEDSFVTAEQIAHVATENQYDLILMGRESLDFNSGVVHGLVGAMLNIPSYSPVMKLDIADSVVTFTREIDGGKEVLEATLPLVLGCQEPIAEWKIPNMRGIMTAKSKPFQVLEPIEASVMTKPLEFTLPKPKGDCKIIPLEEIDSLVKLLQTEAKVL